MHKHLQIPSLPRLTFSYKYSYIFSSKYISLYAADFLLNFLYSPPLLLYLVCPNMHLYPQ